MSNRAQSFYKAEKKLYLGAMLCAVVFLSLSYGAPSVSKVYAQHFYVLSAYGLIFLISYSSKLYFLGQSQRNSLDSSKERERIHSRLKEIEFNRTAQFIIIFIGFAAVLTAICGFYKTLLAGSGAGLLLGSAVWLAIELISELQTREYLQHLDKKSE